MMRFHLLALLLLTQRRDAVVGTPLFLNPETPAIVAGATAAGIASLPLGGPLWLNGAIAGNQQTSLHTSPDGFLPVAVRSDTEIWGAQSTSIQLRITYRAYPGADEDQSQVVAGLWWDRANLWDMKNAAIELKSEAPRPTPGTSVFTRYFSCSTGDIIVPTRRSYVFLKVENERIGVRNCILSERFTTMDNRWTALVSGSAYTITCRFTKDVPGESLPITQESRHYSNNLPPDLSGTNTSTSATK